MPKPEKIILVCTNQRPPGHPKGCCAEGGARDLPALFKDERDRLELKGKVGVAGTSCLGPCHLGPVAVVMPDNVWYKGVAREDVEEIMASHILGGKPVERLLASDADWEG